MKKGGARPECLALRGVAPGMRSNGAFAYCEIVHMIAFGALPKTIA
jgi:hypothetical protein